MPVNPPDSSNPPAPRPADPAGAAESCAPRLPMRVTLRDGREVLLRAIRDDDRAGVLEAFDLLSADARYTRFMTAMKDLPDSMLEAVVHPVGHDCTLVAEMTDGSGDLVGGARYNGIPGSKRCEFAVTLLDGWRANGLARRLMEALIDCARAEGFELMEGYILASNRGMRGLARRLGFKDVASPDDATLRVATLDLRQAPGKPPRAD
ncbi:GNAT family N-acetyltransferase [Cupriavidus pauculus]|uniref:GNAT family N-acetyltransferase n=1 Tax=Cupriavidus pauculus TaxID=82633 RepID=UPI001BA8BB36|nr:GNAT family N-acetyltransferase [Cupriavidus pauculus]UAK99514.1 GNAT family N-acetyltransferase [Cupriavidus pauculus]